MITINNDHHLEDPDMMDMFLKGQGMVTIIPEVMPIRLELVTHLGVDQT